MERSQLLRQKIKAQISQNGGWIPFSRYMETVLYAPEYGYYSADLPKFGPVGDFITAPELSPLFGQTIANCLAPCLHALQQAGLPPHILEFGAGSGKLAETLVQQLTQLGAPLAHYDILEISPDLAKRQQERLAEAKKQHAWHTELRWLQAMPKAFVGIILANEVLDALPCEVIMLQQGRWFFQGVGIVAEQLQWSTGGEVPKEWIPQSLQNIADFPEGYTTEIHPQSNDWINTLSRNLQTGLFLSFDYGFPAHEFYHPQRQAGSLMTHHRHQSMTDPFYLPGLCDLTSHVEWSGISKTAIDAGADALYLNNQGSFLLEAGIGDLALQAGDPNNPKQFLPISQALQKLLSEAEMGELFKVFAFTKNLRTLFPLAEDLSILPGLGGRNRLAE